MLRLLVATLVVAIVIEPIFRKRDSTTEFELAVVIPSARSNFELRRALRETWFGDVKRRFDHRIFAIFVVGSQSCHIHPKKRRTPFVCQPTDLCCPIVQRTVKSMHFLSSEPDLEIPNGPVGYDIQVNFPVAISGLGVYDHLGDGFESNVTVILYDTTTENEIFHVVFTPDDSGMLVNGVRFKNLSTTYILAKDYRATIVAEGFSVSDPSAVFSSARIGLDTGGGLISYLNVSRVGYEHGLFPEFDSSLVDVPMYFAAGAFRFEAHVENGTESQCANYDPMEHRVWLERLKEDNLVLQKEAAMYDDILIVDVVDVYRNIPAKMKAAYEWLSNHVKFRYLLKTDDDCFVRIEEILKGLDNGIFQINDRVWWGNFRTHWAVEKFGKWAEVDYTASAYPAFACGSGYVTSYDLIQWIANNSNSLKLYQGEDVCMGIWLSAVCPNLVKDPRWHCFATCSSDLLSLPEQNPHSFLSLWKNLQQCGNPCCLIHTGELNVTSGSPLHEKGHHESVKIHGAHYVHVILLFAVTLTRIVPDDQLGVPGDVLEVAESNNPKDVAGKAADVLRGWKKIRGDSASIDDWIDDSLTVSFQLGQPDGSEIYSYTADEATPIWYRYCNPLNCWYWTPYEDFSSWMPTSTLIVTKAFWSGQKPVAANHHCIRYLNLSNPTPPDEVVDIDKDWIPGE